MNTSLPDPAEQIGYTSSRVDLIPIVATSGSVVACSLHPDLVGSRIDDWARLLTPAKSRESLPGGVRIGFDREFDLVELARLVEAEQSCCSFFTFRIEVTADRILLEVTGPDAAQSVIAALFEGGSSTRAPRRPTSPRLSNGYPDT